MRISELPAHRARQDGAHIRSITDVIGEQDRVLARRDEDQRRGTLEHPVRCVGAGPVPDDDHDAARERKVTGVAEENRGPRFILREQLRG